MTTDAPGTATTPPRRLPPGSALSRSVVAGAAGGFAGGLAFGAVMVAVGTLPTVASIVRTDAPVVGFAVHMAIATALGAGFGLLVRHQRVQIGETGVWGLLYGAIWWFLGPLTVLPLLLGRPVAWDLPGAQAVLPSLVGHLFYGATTAVVFVLLRRDARSARPRPRIGTAVRGVAAGLAVSALLHPALGATGDVTAGGWFLVGAVVGLGYPLVFGAAPERAGPALIRGTAYGFVVWIVGGLTVLPALRGGRLDWSSTAAIGAADLLPGSLLLGAGVAVVFTGLGGLARWLFVDDVRALQVESPGGRGLRATGYGALAGIVGGLLFAVVMVVVNALPGVARLVGAQAPAAGFVVHMLIAQLIGVSYAVLFRRCSFDLVSGIGWGVSYGFLWWVLGNLTLLPVLGGGAPQWSAAGMAVGFPSLVGHLAYGAGLGAVHHRLEDRTNPWWFRRSEFEAARIAAQRDQILGSAPALWALVAFIALAVPVLVGSG